MILFTPVIPLALMTASWYDTVMNKHITRTITGLAFLVVGAAALLNALNITAFNDLFRDFWPVLVILAGFLMLVNHPRLPIWPVAVILFGGLLQLRELEIIDFNVWGLVWPVAIILAGLSILLNRSFTHKNINKNDIDEVTAVFGGSQIKNESDNYSGGSASATFGGVEIDLRQAHIKKEATLKVFALCGGINVRVPEGWAVKSKVTPIFGGIEVKTKPADKNAPVLTIVGDVMFGGVEVKHTDN